MKMYRGIAPATAQPQRVYVVSNDDEYDLSPARSQKVFNHSPDGFAWGYGGSGPAQLALAILLDYLDDDTRAVELHQDFKWKLIAPLTMTEDWTIDTYEIESFIREHEEART